MNTKCPYKQWMLGVLINNAMDTNCPYKQWILGVLISNEY